MSRPVFNYRLDVVVSLLEVREMTFWLMENATGKVDGCGLVRGSVGNDPERWNRYYDFVERVTYYFENEDDLLLFKLMFAGDIKCV